MNSFFSHVPTHSDLRLKSPEMLKDDEDLRVRRACAKAQVHEFSYAVVGKQHWDIRLVSGSGRQAQMMRFSDPQLALRADQLEEYIFFLEKLGRLGYPIYYSRLKGSGSRNQFCVTRPFYPAVLATMNFSTQDESIHVFKRILDSVRDLHDHGITHGHLTPDNVGFEMAQPVLLDIGQTGYSSSARHQRPSLAPELRRGFPLSPSSDVYGLSIILESLLHPEAMSREQNDCAAAMASEDPGQRPTLDWIQRVFSRNERHSSSRHASQQHMSRVGHSSASSSYHQGQSHYNQQQPDFQRGASETVNYQHPPQHYSQPQNSNLKFLLCILLGVSMVAGYQYAERYDLFGGNPQSYHVQWGSNRAETMQEVAIAAVDDDVAAQTVILQSVKKGEDLPYVNEDFFRFVYNDMWSADFTSRDRKLIFSFALQELVHFEPEWSEDVHPAVILGVLSQADGKTNVEAFSDVSTAHLARLPSIYGEAFQRVVALGAENCANESVIGLSKILSGNINLDTMREFLLGGDGKGAVLLGRLRLLFETFKGAPGIFEVAHKLLDKDDPVISSMLLWFDRSALGVWADESLQLKLSLLAGILPPELGDLHKLTDLIRFPVKTVSETAAVRVIPKLGKRQDSQSLFQFLTSGAQKLSREQLVTVVALLAGSEKNQSSKMLSDWFGTKPDPVALTGLIAARSGVGSSDRFNLEAARHLLSLDVDFELPLPLLSSLIAHPEPLVRTFAYQKLNPLIDAHRGLLTRASVSEPNGRMKEQLKQRLRNFEDF